MNLPQRVDHEEQGHAGFQAVLVEFQSIPQPQDPMQVVALVTKEPLEQADVVCKYPCQPMQRLWRVKLGTCSKLFYIHWRFQSCFLEVTLVANVTIHCLG